MGDIEGNSSLIEEYALRLKELKAHILVFPEMVVTGIPVEDLALRKSFREASQKAIVRIAENTRHNGTDELVLVVGYLDGKVDGGPQNAVAIIHAGEIKRATSSNIYLITASLMSFAIS